MVIKGQERLHIWLVFPFCIWKKSRKKCVWCLTLPDGEILSTTTVTKDYAEGQQLRLDKNEHVHINQSKSFRAVFCSKGSSSGDRTIHSQNVLEHKGKSTGQGRKQILWQPLKKISPMIGTSVCQVSNKKLFIWDLLINIQADTYYVNQYKSVTMMPCQTNLIHGNYKLD